jgi:hypothetical protein
VVFLHIQYWNNGGVYPVISSVFSSVFDFPFPDVATANGCPHLFEKIFGMVSGIDYAVVLSDKFFFGIFRNFAKFIVYIGDSSGAIGNRHN